MRKIKEVLRLHFEHQQSGRQIANAASPVSQNTYIEYKILVLYPII